MFILTFGHARKRLDLKDKVNLKICDATTWEANDCNTHTALNLKK